MMRGRLRSGRSANLAPIVFILIKVKSRRLSVAFWCLVFVFASQLSSYAGSFGEGVELGFDLLGSSDNILSIKSNSSVRLRLTFSNTSGVDRRFRIHDYDPYHKELPIPVGCFVKITTKDGEMFPILKANGEWWTQYVSWSTMFDRDDPRNYRTLQSGAKLEYEVSLEKILSTPPGCNWKNWPFEHLKGYRPGDYIFYIRFENCVSQRFTLHVET